MEFFSHEVEYEYVHVLNSERVKSVDVHPTEPWVLLGLYSGVVCIWNYQTNNVEKSIKISESPDMDLDSPTPKFTLDGHLKGVNCVDYFLIGEKQYLLSGSDDYTAKVWDCETKSCVHTLEGHTHNVTAVCVHPELPIIVTGSEDGTVKLWDAITYRLLNTLNFDLERVWAIGYKKGSNQLVFGCDKGAIVVNLKPSSLNLPTEKQGQKD
ncbi:Coatomer, beta' subunit [Quillaja saponaria]|uniref:Coatomer, beta' subunit n=1 Tax=Quillaja saponaria TaxID=32244 RepID=A0AAD7LRE4_QUISA|nr:Coatomer, beta' subunit [Quillaja saponaria]